MKFWFVRDKRQKVSNQKPLQTYGGLTVDKETAMSIALEVGWVPEPV
jgi:hypothetical protein